MNWLKKHKKGALLNLYIQPGASKSEISGIYGDRLKVKIKAPARDGEANQALIEFLANTLDISKSKVSFVRGESSRQKDLLVDISVEEAAKKLTFTIN